MKKIKVLSCSNGVITPSRKRFKVRRKFELANERNLSREEIINPILENRKRFLRHG